MPLSSSPDPRWPSLRPRCSPTIPDQVARIAYLLVGCAMIAGVHSVVWIFAIRAALIRRALW